MMRSFAKYLSKNLALFSLLLVLQIFPQQSFSADYIPTSEIVKEIEKTLLFDKDSRAQMDFYRKQDSRKKSDYTMSAGDSNSSKVNGKSRSSFDIVIVDPKINNFDIREKEKLAYNAASIGQYEVSIELYKKILEVEPKNVYAKFSLAVVYQKLDQYRQSKALYYELLKDKAPNQEEIVGNLLAILVSESPRDAIYLLSRLATENPKSTYILAQSAVAYEKIKNYEQAAALMQRAIVMDPDNVGYKYNLAVIYDKAANYEKALELYANVAKSYSGDNQFFSIDQVQKRIEYIKNKV